MFQLEHESTEFKDLMANNFVDLSKAGKAVVAPKIVLKSSMGLF